MSRKKILFLTIFLFFGIIVGFKDQLARNFYQFCITAYCSHHFGSPPEIEKIYKENDYWVFENITLHHKTTSLKAKRLAFNHALQVLHRRFYFQIIVEDSQIDAMSETRELRSAFKEIASKTFPFWLFKTDFDFSINHGSLSWKEVFNDQSLPHSADFHLFASSSEGKDTFQLSLFLDPAEKAQNSLDLTFKRENELPFHADVAFRKIDCLSLARVSALFDPSFLDLEVAGGTIDGAVHCDYEQTKKATASGKIFLRDLNISHLKSASRFNTDEVCCEFEVKEGKEDVPHLFGRMFLDKGFSLQASNNLSTSQQKVEGDFFVDLQGKGWDLDLFFHNGVSQASEIHGKSYDFHHTRSRFKVVKGLLEFFELEGHFNPLFFEDLLRIRGNLIFDDRGPHIQGMLSALEENQKEREFFDFRFNLSEALSSPKAFPSGWLRTRRIALEKYIWPIFSEGFKLKDKGEAVFCFNSDNGKIFTDFEVYGDVLSYRGNAGIDFHSPNNFSISGTLSNLEIPINAFDTKIVEGACCFSYESQPNALSFSKLSGNLLGNQGVKTHISGDYLNVPDFSKGGFYFDFWMGDKGRDMIRLCGEVVPEEDKILSARHRVDLDLARSHFGVAEPAFFSCVLCDGLNIESFELGLLLDLKAFFHDRQFIQKFFPIFKGAHERIFSGDAKVKIVYEGKNEAFAYELISGPFTVDDYHFDRSSLLGTKKGNIWTLDRADIDDYSLSGRAYWQKDVWHFDRLKLLSWFGWEANFHGMYNTHDQGLEVAIDSFSLNFQKMHHHSPSVYFDFEGALSGTGRINGDFSEGLAFRKLEATLDLFLKAPRSVSDDPLHFFIRKMRFGRDFKEAHCEGISFEIPLPAVPWFVDLAAKKFHPLISEEIAGTIKNINHPSGLQGIVNYEYAPPYSAFQLALRDGRYSIFEEELLLKDFLLERDPFEFKMTGKFALGKEYISWYCRSIASDFSKGELVLLDSSLKSYDFGQPVQPLVILWERDGRFGISVKRASGFFGGLDIDLTRKGTSYDSSSILELTGQVILHPERVRIFLPPELIEKIVDWQIAGSYEFKGQWKFLKKTCDHCFSGKLSSRYFSIKGYQFDELLADVEWDPSHFNFSNLSMNDFSGKWNAETIHFERKKDQSWAFFVPFVRVSDLNPGLICKAGLPRLSKKNSLLIKDFALMNLSGSLNDCSSWKGNGFVSFNNKYKKGTKNSYFDLPTDIFSNLDLDIATLIPTTGFLEYRIENGSVILTKLKDVYSEGKLFKFSLSPSGGRTIDFSGNMDLQFKIKQCNIFFKPVELCSFNIKGSLKNPVWNLNSR